MNLEVVGARHRKETPTTKEIQGLIAKAGNRIEKCKKQIEESHDC